LSRTQSGTRIATTAAPVTAYDKDPKDYLTLPQRYAGFPLAEAACPDAAAPPPFTVPIEIPEKRFGLYRRRRH
jgi:hypothetical protein